MVQKSCKMTYGCIKLVVNTCTSTGVPTIFHQRVPEHIDSNMSTENRKKKHPLCYHACPAYISWTKASAPDHPPTKKKVTHTITNIVPDKRWLKDYFPFEMVPFHRLRTSFFLRAMTWLDRAARENSSAQKRPNFQLINNPSPCHSDWHMAQTWRMKLEPLVS